MFNIWPGWGPAVEAANFYGVITLTWLILSYQHDVKQLTNFLKTEKLALVSWCRPATALQWMGVQRRWGPALPTQRQWRPPAPSQGWSATWQEADPNPPMGEGPQPQIRGTRGHPHADSTRARGKGCRVGEVERGGGGVGRVPPAPLCPVTACAWGGGALQ